MKILTTNGLWSHLWKERAEINEFCISSLLLLSQITSNTGFMQHPLINSLTVLEVRRWTEVSVHGLKSRCQWCQAPSEGFHGKCTSRGCSHSFTEASSTSAFSHCSHHHVTLVFLWALCSLLRGPWWLYLVLTQISQDKLATWKFLP